MENRVCENPIIGDKAIFLKTAAETGGEYTLIEVELAPGGGNTLHLHRDFTETFTALEGELLVQEGKTKKWLRPGESHTVPLNVHHLFRNPSSKPIRFRVELRPGHAGFENTLRIAYGLTRDGFTNKKSIPKNFSHLALLVSESGTVPAGIFSLLMPLFRWKARQARGRGIEAQLLNRYCR